VDRYNTLEVQKYSEISTRGRPRPWRFGLA